MLSYSYDVLNRKLTDGWLSACSGVAANSVTTAYDLGGRVTEWSNTPGDSQTPTYDTAGRMTEMVTSTSGMTGTLPVKYTLDANSNRTKLTWPGGKRIRLVREDGLPLGGALHHIRFTRAAAAFSTQDKERAGLLAKRLGVMVDLAG